jgi:hypothetical protein
MSVTVTLWSYNVHVEVRIQFLSLECLPYLFETPLYTDMNDG